MNKTKMFLNDEALDQVTGGTILHHVFRQGETIESVAKYYKVDEELLRKWNNIPQSAKADDIKELDIFF